MKQILIGAGMAWSCAMSGFAQDTPTPKNAPEPVAQGADRVSYDGEQVKRFVVSAKFKQVIGGFDRFVPPHEESEFEIDLAKMPLEKLRYSFNRGGSEGSGELSFKPALKVERVETNKFTTTIFLSSEGQGGNAKIQITGNTPLAHGSDVYLYLYQESGGRIAGMAGARGKLKEQLPKEK